MLKIKLARFGKKKQPHYRIVVNEARDKRDGQYVAQVGHYAPNQQPKLLHVDMEAYNAWLKKGAQPTETVAALIKRAEAGDAYPVRPVKLSKKAKAKQAEAKQAAAEAAAKPAEPEVAAPEAPVAEAQTEAAPAETPAETTESTVTEG